MRVYDTAQRSVSACMLSESSRVYISPSSTGFPAHKSHTFKVFMYMRNLVSLAAALLGVGAARVVLPLVGCAYVSFGSTVPQQGISGKFVQAIIAFWAELAP